MTTEADQADPTESEKDKSDTSDGFAKPWFQWWAAFLSLIMMALVISMPVLFWIVALNKEVANLGDDLPGGPLGALIAMFGILMTGIFVFMALRIDRGAQVEARKVARKVARKEARKAARKEVDGASAEVHERVDAEIAKVEEAVRTTNNAVAAIHQEVAVRVRDRLIAIQASATRGAEEARKRSRAKDVDDVESARLSSFAANCRALEEAIQRVLDGEKS